MPTPIRNTTPTPPTSISLPPLPATSLPAPPLPANRQEFGGATADATKALELDPQYAKAYYRRGDAAVALGHFKDAVRDFRAAVRLAPGDPDLRRKVGAGAQTQLAGWLVGVGARSCIVEGSVPTHPPTHFPFALLA
jgi:tetratricopeptide (TPR) repeat protein